MDVDGGSTSSQDNVVGEEPEVSSVFRPITPQPKPFLRGEEETLEEYVSRIAAVLLSVPPQETSASPGTQLSTTAPPVLPVPSQETFCLPPPPPQPPNPIMPPSFSPQDTAPAAALPLSSLELAYHNTAPPQPLNPNSPFSLESSTDSSSMPPLSPQEITSEPPPVKYPIVVPYSKLFAGSRNPPPWFFIPTPPSLPPPSSIDRPYRSPPADNCPMIPEMPPPPTQQDQDQYNQHGEGRAVRRKVMKSEIIERPYPWATTRRARIQTMQYMQFNRINFIRGRVHCQHCLGVYDVEYDLQSKFIEVSEFIAMKKRAMNGEAPDVWMNVWMNPVLPSCRICGARNGVEPLIEKKRSINWLFLLLGQMLGYLELPHLRYFCKHTENPQQFADKPRVLYLTYMGLCKQLFPYGPFDP